MNPGLVQGGRTSSLPLGNPPLPCSRGKPRGINFNVDSEWFTGNSEIKTYQLDELMGSKLRALYQRSKGRDLFDMWYLLNKDMLDAERVIEVFKAHGTYVNQIVTRKMFEKNMLEKAKDKNFRNEVVNLIVDDTDWNFDEAYQVINSSVIANL